jgi:hypothetical protein
MMPAEIVTRTVPVPPDTLSQTQDLLDELPVGQPLELIVRCHHAESLGRPSSPLFRKCVGAHRVDPALPGAGPGHFAFAIVLFARDGRLSQHLALAQSIAGGHTLLCGTVSLPA